MQLAYGGALMLYAVQPNVKRVLDRSRLTCESNFFWSADQAIREEFLIFSVFLCALCGEIHAVQVPTNFSCPALRSVRVR